MYYAKGMRDLLRSTQLTIEFFDDLDDFQLHFVEMCFKQSMDDKMGMMTEVEHYNYQLFEEFKMRQVEQMYGDYFKSAA